MTNPLYDIALSMLFRTKLRKSLALIAHYGSAEEAWNHIDEAGMQEAMQRAEQECEWIAEHGIRVWTLSDEDYPYRLRQCPDRPIVLFGKGNLHPSDGHIVSIVGTRRPTERGKELATKLVKELHEQLEQVTIISGGAYGIDITAHRAAIECGIPTIIVPAHGLDRIYPIAHRQDAIRTLGNGGILTEYMSGTEPEKINFVARNRIVAGLADAVVVVESRNRGGSLITAGLATDYNRDLFAFPGRPGDEEYRGCNDLIRLQRATLIDSAHDLVQAMGWQTQQPKQTRLFEGAEATENEGKLLSLLRQAEDGMHINQLVAQSGMDYAKVSGELIMLELAGKVRAVAGGIYRAV
jgi:DNA processing protein